MVAGITGADGFIGSHLTKKLDSLGVHYKIFVEGGDLDEFIKDIDLVLHMAGRAIPPDSEIKKSNIEFTKELLDHLKNSKVKRIIYLSTVAVYTNKGNPKDIYGASKLKAEKLIKSWGKNEGVTTQILRPFSVYGPGNKKGLIYEFIKSINTKNEVTIYGDGKIKRDLLFVDDLVDAILKSLNYQKSFEADIVYGRQYSLLEIVKIFEKILNKKIKIKFMPQDTSKPTNIKTSPKKANNILSWVPKVTLEDGLRKSL